MTYDEILDFPHSFCDVDAYSLRGYFYKLLNTLWREGEGFNSKRPFGNSGWQCDVFTALVHMGAVDATLNEDWEEWKDAEILTQNLIHYIFKGN